MDWNEKAMRALHQARYGVQPSTWLMEKQRELEEIEPKDADVKLQIDVIDTIVRNRMQNNTFASR